MTLTQAQAEAIITDHVRHSLLSTGVPADLAEEIITSSHAYAVWRHEREEDYARRYARHRDRAASDLAPVFEQVAETLEED